jgi:branched-chain amino acid transport system permease protein
VDVLVQGALTSAVIALVALGFSLVYGVGGIVNLAHGSFFMLGAYSAYAMTQRGAPLQVAVLISTLAVAILVQSGVQFFYGGLERQLPGFVSGRVEVLGVGLQQTRVLAGLVALVAVVAVLLVLSKTPAGRMVRAVAEDEEASRLIGVRPERVTLYVLAIGAGLAGLAGVLTAPYGVLTPTMWLLPLTQAFAIVILGGLGSIQGTVLAAVVVGFLDRFVAFNVEDGDIKVGLVTVAVILATLVLRPQGFLGKVVR